MIKAKTTQNDLLLGLSEENIKRLKEGMPIKFNLAEIYPEIDKGSCFIIYGETEEAIAKTLRITPETEIRKDED
jgi:hypothetical protein